MAWKHREAKTEARLIRAALGVPYEEMLLVWWPRHRGANVQTKNGGLTGAERYTAGYLLSKGATLREKS